MSLAHIVLPQNCPLILILKVAWYFELMVLSFSALTDSLEFEFKKDKISFISFKNAREFEYGKIREVMNRSKLVFSNRTKTMRKK